MLNLGPEEIRPHSSSHIGQILLIRFLSDEILPGSVVEVKVDGGDDADFLGDAAGVAAS